MSDFVALYTAFSGLQAARRAIDTASHNIANAGTEGYTRQRVELATRLPYEDMFGPIGTGVDVADITRARNAMLDDRVRASTALQGRLETLGDLLYPMETALNEPHHGITAAVGSLWAAFEDLALDPPDTAGRLAVISGLEDVAATVRGIAIAWDEIGDDAAVGLASRVDEVNRLLDEVARLNSAILQEKLQPGTPNDLMDERDLILDQLATIAGTRATVTDSGSVRVSLNGLGLVHDGDVSRLSFDPATNTITHASGATVDPGGEMAGYESFLNSELPTHRAALDALATEIADALNAQHASGYTPGGAAGGQLFTYVAGDAALTLRVAVSDPAEIAAAAGGGPPVPAFDGDNAAAMAALRTSLSAAGGTATLEGAARSLVSAIGESMAAARAGAISQAALSNAAQSSRDQAHGVSIDEEMVNLVTFQRAYEAAARAMTAVDEALDTLINRTGLVGR